MWDDNVNDDFVATNRSSRDIEIDGPDTDKMADSRTATPSKPETGQQDSRKAAGNSPNTLYRAEPRVNSVAEQRKSHRKLPSVPMQYASSDLTPADTVAESQVWGVADSLLHSPMARKRFVTFDPLTNPFLVEAVAEAHDFTTVRHSTPARSWQPLVDHAESGERVDSRTATPFKPRIGQQDRRTAEGQLDSRTTTLSKPGTGQQDRRTAGQQDSRTAEGQQDRRTAGRPKDSMTAVWQKDSRTAEGQQDRRTAGRPKDSRMTEGQQDRRTAGRQEDSRTEGHQDRRTAGRPKDSRNERQHESRATEWLYDCMTTGRPQHEGTDHRQQDSRTVGWQTDSMIPEKPLNYWADDDYYDTLLLTRQQDKRAVADEQSVSKRRSSESGKQIKLCTYDGSSPFETFVAKFRNASCYNQWTDQDGLAHMKASLTGSAANVLWDTPDYKQDTLNKLMDVLSTRFGNAGMAEKFRCELRTRRRAAGETLQSLHQDVQRLASLAFQGPWNEAVDVIARDAFIDAMNDDEFSAKIREREPTSLDQAVRTAMRLESYRRASHGCDVQIQNQVRATSSTDNTDRQFKELFQVMTKQQEKLQQMQDDQLRLTRKLLEMEQKGSERVDSRPTFQRRKKEDVVCFGCSTRGHYARECPNKGVVKKEEKKEDVKATQTVDLSKVTPKEAKANSSWAFDQNFPVYVYLKIRNKTVSCLVDTGCDLNLLPGDLLSDDEQLEPHQSKVTAANGTPISIIGKKVFQIKLNDVAFETEMLVSRDVDEAMIGVQFLMQHDSCWHVSKGTVVIDGHELRLHAKPSKTFCRRVVCQKTVVIPALTQQDVCATMPLRNFNDSADDMLIEATMLQPGVVIGSSIVPCDDTCVRVRVCNTKSEDVTIDSGTALATAHSTTVLEQSAPTMESDRRDKVTKIVKELCEKLPDEIDHQIRKDFESLLFKYERILSVDEFDLGYTNLLTHKINTGTHKPVREALRRHPQAYLQFIDDEVEKMLQAKVIEPARSEWASNVCLAKKKDGGLRFAIDFRKVNSLSTPDSYPLPRIDNCLDTLSDACWFSTIDLRSGFWQVAQDQADADKTTFITRKGSFRFRVLPFGLQGSPSLFQRVMDLVLTGLNWQSCLVYIDDIIVFSRSQEQQLTRLAAVFDRLAENNLKIKPSKICLFQRELIFLGYKISEHGIAADPEKTRTVLEMAVPKNIKELRSYLGCFGYYRKFISQFSQVAEPLYALLRKGAKFCWMKRQQNAFDILKQRLASAPVLALPIDDAPTIIDCDASDTGLGAVLSQVIDGEEKPLAYASRTYSKQELNYCITRRELLGMIFGLKQFRQYCLGRKIVVRTDHAPLITIQSTPNPSAQMCRWLDFIAEYEMQIQHRPGLRHGNADGCSRANAACKQCKLSAEDYKELDHKADNHRQSVELDATVKATTDSEYRVAVVKSVNDQLDMDKAQEQDVDIGPIFAAMLNSTEPPDWDTFSRYGEDTKNLLAQWPMLEMKDRIIYRKWLDSRTQQSKWLQCLIPVSKRHEVLHLAHTGMSGGHYGIKKTALQVQRRAYWKTWRQDSARFVKRCSQCATYRRGLPPRLGYLQDMQVGSPMERAGIDLTGPWPKSGNKIYILTFIDHFTKWADAVPIANKEAETVARALVTQIFSKIGVVLQLLSDCGREFDNALMAALCNLLGIHKLRTTPYKPSTNASVERLHRSMNAMIAKCVDDNQRNWTEVVPYVMSAYRSAVHESTGYSPNFLFYGRELYAPIDLLTQPAPDSLTVEDYVDSVEKNTRYAHALARECLQTQTVRRKRLYDMKVNHTDFKTHDWVYYFYPRRRVGKSPKWQRLYTGPFLVTERLGPVNYVIQKSAKADPIIVHSDKLRLFDGDAPKSWLIPGHRTDCDQVHPLDVTNHDEMADDVSERNAVLPMENLQDSTAEEVDVVDKQLTRPRRDLRRPAWLKDYVSSA